MIGGFQDTVDFDPGPGSSSLTSFGMTDIYLCKLNSSGNFVYARQMGGTANDIGEHVAVDAAGHAYTTGSFRGTADFDPGPGVVPLSSAGAEDAFVVRLDAAGNLVWARQLGGAGSDIGRGLALDTNGFVYTMGPYVGTSDFDPGPGEFNLTSGGGSAVFISKLDANGNFSEAVHLQGGVVDGFGVAVQGSGRVYTTGGFTGTADFDPGPGEEFRESVVASDIFISQLGPPLLSIIPPPAPVHEGNSGTTPALFTLTLSAPTSQSVTVSYNTMNGTATANEDYLPVTSSATIPAGETTTVISIPVIGDMKFEPDETFSVSRRVHPMRCWGQAPRRPSSVTTISRPAWRSTARRSSRGIRLATWCSL